MTQQPFAVFDIDGTIIRWQLFHAIVTQLATENKLSHRALDEINTSRESWNRRTSSDSFSTYEQTILDVYHAAIKDLSVEDFAASVQSVFEHHKDQVYTYTRDLIKELKAKNYLLFAVSGSQQEIVELLGEHYGFDDVIGAQYTIQDGHFVGTRNSPVETGKGVLVKQLATQHNASWKGSYAVGDTFSDAAMLSLVENPIAFNPNSTLLKEARKQGWDVVVERKDVIYKLTPGTDNTYSLL